MQLFAIVFYYLEALPVWDEPRMAISSPTISEKLSGVKMADAYLRFNQCDSQSVSMGFRTIDLEKATNFTCGALLPRQFSARSLNAEGALEIAMKDRGAKKIVKHWWLKQLSNACRL